MTHNDLHAILAEFFRDSFCDDATVVAEWLAQGGQNVDEVVTLLDVLHPSPLTPRHKSATESYTADPSQHESALSDALGG